MSAPTWMIFQGDNTPSDRLKHLPAPPAWRSRDTSVAQPKPPKDLAKRAAHWHPARGASFRLRDETLKQAVNAALYLRRPLLLTGQPGTGKSSLIYAVAHELGLGPVLKWPITSRATLKNGLYDYDALRRLNDLRQRQATDQPATDDIGEYLTLGPLGAALYPSDWPRALLIDEIDKADLDLPNDLLNIFEDGEFQIPELAREQAKAVEVNIPGFAKRQPIPAGGRVAARQFPFVVMTSNNEREFPAPFLRRCIRAQMPEPTLTGLAEIVASHLGPSPTELAATLIQQFNDQKSKLATDQLLNAVFLTIGSTNHHAPPLDEEERKKLIALLLQHLS